jgi:hypothetical protein
MLLLLLQSQVPLRALPRWLVHQPQPNTMRTHTCVHRGHHDVHNQHVNRCTRNRICMCTGRQLYRDTCAEATLLCEGASSSTAAPLACVHYSGTAGRRHTRCRSHINARDVCVCVCVAARHLLSLRCSSTRLQCSLCMHIGII